MIYANREATRKAIRTMISKHEISETVIDKSYKDNELPKKVVKRVFIISFLEMLLAQS